MEQTKSVDLPSGATLRINLSKFAVSKALYLAVLEEAKNLELDPNVEVDTNLFKDMFCIGFSSKKIEGCLNECMKQALYNDARITEATFEPVDAREDYMTVCWEVALFNILPFTKSLSRQLSAISGLLAPNQPSK